jgi:hypothetical protein
MLLHTTPHLWNAGLTNVQTFSKQFFLFFKKKGLKAQLWGYQFYKPSSSPESIDGQMGQARWAGPRTARKSPALERPGTKGVVPRAGPARWSDRAWAAPSARWPGTGHDTIFGPARCQPVKITPLRIKSTKP